MFYSGKRTIHERLQTDYIPVSAFLVGLCFEGYRDFLLLSYSEQQLLRCHRKRAFIITALQKSGMKEKRFRENEIEKLLKWYKTREVWLSFLEGNKEQTELDDIKQQ